ncbi:MAG: DF family (seleno)protein [Microbacter sp.]
MIQFQYFEGCPNSKQTLAHLYAVQKELGIDEQDIEIVEVPDADSSERLQFQGSPTILVDGVDIYTGLKPTDNSYTCRVYIFEGKRTGVIPIEFIREKFRAWMEASSKK